MPNYFEKPPRANDSIDKRSLNTLYFKMIPYDIDNVGRGALGTKEIEIKNIIPEELSYSYSPKFTSQQILGRMSPIQLYTGGSDMVYTFTLTVHEDALKSFNYDRIDTFVDDLKSLAYPYIDSKNIMRAQRVYFQLGEISGYGVVNVSVGWKKPIRNGRYIMADISFNITAETIFPKVEMFIDQRVLRDKETYLVYYDSVRISSETQEMLNEYNEFAGYGDVSIGDFITDTETSLENKQIRISHTVRYFDEVTSRLAGLLDIFDLADPKSEEIDNLQVQINKISDFNISGISQTISNIPSQYTDKTEAIEHLKTLRDDLVEYIEDTYYEEVSAALPYNERMLAEERDALVEEIEIKITGMILLYEEVFSYAAGK